jgi:hypothetical protein
MVDEASVSFAWKILGEAKTLQGKGLLNYKN